MKKIGVCFLICIMLVVGIVSATENESASDKVQKGYDCVKKLIDDKKDSELSLQDAIFGILALGSKDKLISKINNEKKDSAACWPKSGCELKETAQVMLAYERIGKSTDEIKTWLLSRKSSISELTWFLEIDINNHLASNCKISYNGKEYGVDIGEDMKLSSDAGPCLSLHNSKYWLVISNGCLDKEFSISCDEDFVTTLLYQKSGGETIFVSSTTHSSSSLGTTKESVKANCLANQGSNRCNYEGTLWASLALSKAGEDASEFLPYLVVLADENKKYFPETFLYIVGKEEGWYSEIVKSQKQGKYWQVTGSPYNRFYDTSLALVGIGGGSANEAENAKEYLLDVQTEDGCWNNNNLRDSAFVLYSAWPRSISQIDISIGPGSSGTSVADCENASYSCERAIDCQDAGGLILYAYSCSELGRFCCSEKIVEKSCSEKSGVICASNEKCSGNSVSAKDGSCCLGKCEKEEGNACEILGYACKFACDNDEQEKSYGCDDSGKVCCEQISPSPSPINIWWIIGLLVLICIVVLGIIFRKKIQIWRFGMNKGSAPVSGFRRGGGGGGMMMAPARPMFGGMRRSVLLPQQPLRKNTEMDEVMRKLREMSK